MTDLIQSARTVRKVLLADRYRPRYHFVTPEGVCSPFDPNGALYWKGRYHLMYIVQTEKGHCWAHASSSDLLHWRHHPLALEPGGGDTGIYSGGAFIDKDGVPTLSYWGLGDGRGVCLATSTDDMLEKWTKSPHNPVIPQVEFGIGRSLLGTQSVSGYRGDTDDEGEPVGAADPSQIWIKDGRYYLMTGNLLVLRKYGLEAGQKQHQGDRTYLFVSDDLIRWKYLHPFYESNRTWTQSDEDNMCPDFFPLGDRHMLLFISHNRGCQFYIGRYESHRFHPETHGRMSWVDNAFFAPESLTDDRGRRIMWAWIRDGREKATQEASMWSGTMSLPRELWLGEDKTLRMRVPEEFKALRQHPRRFTDFQVPADGELRLEGVSGDSLELYLEIATGEAQRFGVKVCRSPDGEEETAISYDSKERAIKIDTTRSSLGEGTKSVESGPFALGDGEPLRLRIFVDRSVVEVFANDRQAVMRRIYPTREDALGVSLFSRGGRTVVKVLKAWEMAPANPW